MSQHVTAAFCAQGWENYQKEFKQLRRSFRYNEYSDIRKLNPPTTFLGRVCGHGLGTSRIV